MCYEDAFYRQLELAKKARKRSEARPSTERTPATQPARSVPATEPRKTDEELERELETA